MPRSRGSPFSLDLTRESPALSLAAAHGSIKVPLAIKSSLSVASIKTSLMVAQRVQCTRFETGILKAHASSHCAAGSSSLSLSHCPSHAAITPSQQGESRGNMRARRAQTELLSAWTRKRRINTPPLAILPPSHSLLPPPPFVAS